MHFNESQEHRILALQINRDIYMLYHELAQYSHIMGDLDYANLYPLPYWDFIANSALDWQLDAFIAMVHWSCFWRCHGTASKAPAPIWFHTFPRLDRRSGRCPSQTMRPQNFFPSLTRR